MDLKAIAETRLVDKLSSVGGIGSKELLRSCELSSLPHGIWYEQIGRLKIEGNNSN